MRKSWVKTMAIKPWFITALMWWSSVYILYLQLTLKSHEPPSDTSRDENCMRCSFTLPLVMSSESHSTIQYCHSSATPNNHELLSVARDFITPANEILRHFNDSKMLMIISRESMASIGWCGLLWDKQSRCGNAVVCMSSAAFRSEWGWSSISPVFNGCKYHRESTSVKFIA